MREYFLYFAIPNLIPNWSIVFSKSEILCCLIFIFFFSNVKCQVNEFPYSLNTQTDIAICVTGVGLQTAGYFLNHSKDNKTFPFTGVNRKNIPVFDRWSANYYSEDAAALSDFTELAGIAMPLSLSLVNGINSPRKGIILLTMYAETMLLTTGMINTVKGSVCRYRPYVYSNNLPNNKDDSYAVKSFYSGHTSATAASSFFAAKLFCDLYPQSKLKPYAWLAAAGVPAITGALRIKAGRHFLSDVLTGYITGAASGLLIPHLHKKRKGKKTAKEVD